MEPARATWTDERLDDLADRMDRGFDRVDRELRDLRAEVRSGDEAIRVEMNARFVSLERTIHRFGGGMLLAFVAAFVSLLLTGA